VERRLVALAWKAIEKRIANWLSQGPIKATRQSKIFMGEAVEDISWGPMSVEVKSRGVVPKYIDQWLEQATTNAGGKIPVVLWHRDGMHEGKQFAILKASDFKFIVEEWKGKNE
jgi:hypothetical protein